MGRIPSLAVIKEPIHSAHRPLKARARALRGKLNASTSTSWTLCTRFTVNPANHAAPAACALGDLHREGRKNSARARLAEFFAFGFPVPPCT